MDTSESTVEYRPIPNFPGYRIGTDGSVWTCRQHRNPPGQQIGTPRVHLFNQPWRLLTIYTDTWGYRSVLLWNLETKRHSKKSIHALLLEVFVAPRSKGMLALHKNDNRDDNRLENLYWGTKAENVRDAQRNRRFPMGSAHHNTKISDDDVRMIRQRSAAGESASCLADAYGITTGHARDIIRRKERPYVQ